MPMNTMHTFAIGDVHGCADLLEALLVEIKDKAEREGFDYRVVFLGDVIDRGPDSRRAMELVIETLRDVAESKLILGNHESLLLRAVEGDDFDVYRWVSQGGMEALHSYGFRVGDKITPEAIASAVGEEHLACMRTAERYVELEGHILVHAGVRPGTPMKRQSHHDLMWIREGFLDYVESFGKVIVHGHTPTTWRSVEVWPNRIAVDTHAYERALLSAVQIDPTGAISTLQSEDLFTLQVFEEEPRRMTWEAVLRKKGFELEIVDGFARPGAPILEEPPLRTATSI